MAIPDEVKKQAAEAAAAIRQQKEIGTLPAKDATTDDHRQGPTTLPGEIGAGYGRNLNRLPPEPTPEPGR
jgi:hypothetical protein